MSESRSITACVIVEWPDHHCGDDLVCIKISHSDIWLGGWLRPNRRFASIQHLQLINFCLSGTICASDSAFADYVHYNPAVFILHLHMSVSNCRKGVAGHISIGRE